MTTRVLPVLLLTALLLAGCTEPAPGSIDPPPEPPEPPEEEPLRISEVVSSVSVGDVEGVLKSGPLPTSSGGSELEVDGNDTTINGGVFDLQISSDVPLDTLYVALEGSEGYYEIDLPAARGNLQIAARAFCGPRGSHRDDPRRCPMLKANVYRNPPTPRLAPPRSTDMQATGSFNVCTSGREATTLVITPPGCHTFDLLRVGSGDVQVTLSWNVDSDVDLHVVDPNGDEVYYGNKSIQSGGKLDLDSNASCSIDGTRNENVTWQSDAPNGTYIVRVDYWSSCGVEATNYTVRINNGNRTSTFTGTFTGDGNRGGAGDGREIVRFVHP